MKYIAQKATAIAILSVLATPAIAAGPTLFGKAHLSAALVSEDDPANQPDTSSVSIKSHKSRVGIKGDVDAGGNRKVVYRFVWQIDMSDNAKSSDDNLKSREQYLGLQDSWGEVRIGRDDSPYKKVAKKNVELLTDTYADYNNIISKSLDTRNNSSISFRREIGPGKISAMYGAGNDEPGGENERDSISIAYEGEMRGIRFGAAYQTLSDSASGADDEIEGLKLVGGYTIKNTKIGYVFESVDNGIGGGVADEDNMLLAVKHKLPNGNSIKFVYGVRDLDVAGSDPTMLALAYDVPLTKMLSIYGLFVSGSDGGLAGDPEIKLDGDGQAIAAGVIAKF